MISILLTSFWYFLPAGIANVIPPLASHVPILKKWSTPLDLGHSFRNIRIFGDHKTIRGFTSGLVCGTLTCLLQAQIIPMPYNPIVLGFLLSFGALSGDAIKSFFKRRTDIKPGKTWFPFDQLDYIIGGLFISSLYYIPPVSIYVGVFLLYFGLHLLFSYIGFLLHLKSQPL